MDTSVTLSLTTGPSVTSPSTSSIPPPPPRARRTPPPIPAHLLKTSMSPTTSIASSDFEGFDMIDENDVEDIQAHPEQVEKAAEGQASKSWLWLF